MVYSSILAMTMWSFVRFRWQLFAWKSLKHKCASIHSAIDISKLPSTQYLYYYSKLTRNQMKYEERIHFAKILSLWCVMTAAHTKTYDTTFNFLFKYLFFSTYIFYPYYSYSILLYTISYHYTYISNCPYSTKLASYYSYS